MTESYAERLASASPLASAAFALGATVTDADQARANMADLRARADVTAVRTDGEDDFDAPHLADPFAPMTLCDRRKARDLDETRAARVADFCPSCVDHARDRATSREAALAAAEKDGANPPEPARPPITNPAVHRFDCTAEAYDASQGDGIHDGDLLVIPGEGIVAILTDAWPVALTTRNGELHKLTGPAHEIEDGRYAASVEKAMAQAAACGVDLDPLHQPQPFKKGERIVCTDGGTRTVASLMRSGPHTWVETEEGSAWRADRCELVDTSRVDEAKCAARTSAAVLRGPQAPTGEEHAMAVRDLGDALRYLAQADPAALAELHAEGNQRIALEVPRLSVVPGDILHAHGARLTVLDTGISAAPAPQFWARVYGVDKGDRHATYRAPWTLGMSVESAAWDIVAVERIAPALPC
ncbi:hypothetical protein HUT18_11755 [Streptomyces sp. NA04227]|uniref:hypothetical protein n=1 Tax=Streptomyces sp. NA04227 TaxID=2742136 RepID=UPI001590CCA3|nr:hypothetical protein [Streptomyces sp. NA04227]QKW06973.1 hypothetical protein HUT18_11755 [Streptomyces sp. NA04227]